MASAQGITATALPYSFATRILSEMISAETIGDSIKWLQENMLIQIVVFQGQIIGVELPNFIEMEVVDCEPAVKGDTATGASKRATVETGARVMVPLFGEQGDHIRIDTRTGEYLERV